LRFRGPWLALRPGKAEPAVPLVAVPATLARIPAKTRDEPGKWLRAEPKTGRLPGWENVAGLLPVWRKGPANAKHPGGFLTPAGIRAFLAGGVPADSDWFEPGDLYGFEERTGIAIDMTTLTAAESQIYGIQLLSLRSRVVKVGPWHGAEVCLYAEVLPPPDAPDDLSARLTGPIPFGGEGRYVLVHAGKPSFTWPEPERPTAISQQSLWVLVSPAPFSGSNGRDSWRPDRIPADRLRAAASGTAVAFSGWDIARNGRRPTHFAVPAGSVYFVDGEFLPGDGSLCTDPEDVAQGWGFALRGVWNHA
jgi:CRISPR-associated protein Cmr3